MITNSERVKWLETAYAALKLALLPEAPEAVTITFGFPSKGAKVGSKATTQGQVHYDFMDGLGGTCNKCLLTLNPCIFESPSKVLHVLLHEMIHCAYPKAGHKGKFKETALRLGFEGAMTATYPGEVLRETLRAISATLPAMPAGYGSLTAKTKTQSTRMIKYKCFGCGQIIRAATDELKVKCVDCDLEYEPDA